jgi:hypothetical protein
VSSEFAALFQAHRHNASSLTAWDEVAAFLALTLLTRFIGSAFA